MIAVDFDGAPPPTRIGARLLVPIHITDLHARVRMDAAARCGHVDATITYVLGPSGGTPFFDLRQPVDRCWIDDAAADPETIAARDVGEPTPCSSVRVIDVPQQAHSMHSLRVVYRPTTPLSDLGGAYPPVLRWLPGPRLRWSFGMADLHAGRYLEAWFPANLPFDHFPVTLDIGIVGTPIPHTVITNGHVSTFGANSWSIRFPAWFTTMSPLVEIHAADAVQTASAAVTLPSSGRAITISASKFAGAPEDLSANIARITALLADNERRYGAFAGDSYVCFLPGAWGGMEYAHGATTSENALRHEVLHSWFARGITPASQADGWWDEGFAQFRDDGDAAIRPFDFRAPPVELCSRRPFQRITPTSSYKAGSRFFGGVAAVIGRDRLLAAMGELYTARLGKSVSTALLETHLLAGTAAAQAIEVVDAFHRFVYGFHDPTPAPRLAIRGVQVVGCGPDFGVAVRVHNSGGLCRHFIVAFAVNASGETHLRYPEDFFPAVAAVAGFDLAPGREQTLTARVSVDRGHSLLAWAHARCAHWAPDQPSAAQRNLAVE